MTSGRRTTMRATGRALVAAGVLTAVGLVLVATPSAAAARQRTFTSPEAAVEAFVAAVKADDDGALLAIFGPEARDLVWSGDPVLDEHARERFLVRAGERVHLERVGDDFAVLSAGNDDWPFAIPLMLDGAGWYFDTQAGLHEILNRRIGRNELYTIDVCREFVAAQREYARMNAAAAGGVEYAQRLRSTPGTHDGLYWEAGDGETASPMGPLMASAEEEGYGPRSRGGNSGVFHGYKYRILKAQGPDAPGGRKGYVEDGRMRGGFALVAYPAAYGSSGVMTFIVNQQGVVFQKDLGPRTPQLGPAITMYNPDASWEPVTD